jgi:SAM-dependent methyltransferase
MRTEKNWYRAWFDSAYYHLLYRKDHEREAMAFTTRLVAFLQPFPGALMLDAACGKGRPATELATFGYDVTGIDLSEKNILEARKMEHAHLSFFQHDIRLPLRIRYFDYAFSFFTGFGYFDTERENENALHTMCHALRKDGVLLIDCLNSSYVEQHLVSHEMKIVDGVEFNIQRACEGGYFLTEIHISDPARLAEQQFTERLRAYSRDDLENMLTAQGMQIVDILGDYQFHPWQECSSPRLILIAKRVS